MQGDTGRVLSYSRGQHLPPPPVFPCLIKELAIKTIPAALQVPIRGNGNVGAVAELFDISCLYNTVLFEAIPDLAIGVWKSAPPSLTPQQIISKLQPLSSPAVLGEHFYVLNPLTGQGLNPEWNFSAHGRFKGNADAYVVAAKVNGTAAPTGSQDIDWVSLKSLTGKLAQQVYRTDTRLGQPPASCTPGSPDITVRYASKYWLFGSSV
ncbi:unnamed protein product [Cyclocybe aegerita]|uniref:Uncharacterized protein n=1 Tax=Cyclocybe aegerita TaxID=1973307 RepID=A0A8S0X4V7_CYCAE|nr:unnamed protein product [Cyclocybe aegerita]